MKYYLSQNSSVGVINKKEKHIVFLFGNIRDIHHHYNNKKPYKCLFSLDEIYLIKITHSVYNNENKNMKIKPYVI